MLKPQNSASIMARTELITEKEPFIHHAQGIRSGLSFPRIDIPVGKGIPMAIPRGTKKIDVRE